jgi:outer membrane protein
MKPTTVPVLVAGMLAVLFAAAAVAEGIGYVDMQQVLQESRLGQAAQARLEERFGDRQQPFAEEEMAIRRLQQNLERDKPLMSRAQVEKKEKEIAERIEKFEKDAGALQQELIKAQQEEGAKIIEPAREAVVKVAEKRKLSAVFEASQANILYLAKDADITGAVIEAMDQATK